MLIPCLLLQFSGCYSMEEVTREEFSTELDYSNLKILTEEREYTFKQGDYSLKDDTIYGLGEIFISG